MATERFSAERSALYQRSADLQLTRQLTLKIAFVKSHEFSSDNYEFRIFIAPFVIGLLEAAISIDLMLEIQTAK